MTAKQLGWTVLVAATLLAACSSSEPPATQPTASVPDTVPDTATSDTTSPATSTPAATEPDPVEPVVDEALVSIGDLLGDDGVLALDAALSLFAAVVAPIEGIEPLDFGDEPPSEGAAMAIRRMEASRPELTAEATAALDEAVAVPGDADEITVEPGTARAREITPSEIPTDPPDADELRTLIGGIVGSIEGRTGHDMTLPVSAAVVPDRRTGGDAITTHIGPVGSPRGCRILLPTGLFGPDAASTMSTLAHEVWHCFQLDASPSAFESAPDWMIEGQAEWAGEAYVGGSESSAGSWNNWLLLPNRRLTGRSYDAVGLYGVAESTGSDPWGTMIPMLAGRDAAAVETLFGGTGAMVAVRQVATALVRVPEMGAEWESYGPGITDAQAAPVITVGEGEATQADLTIGRFASLPVVIGASGGEILRVGFVGGTAGAVAMPGAGTISAAPGETVNLCLRPEGCLCPDGSDPFGAGTLPQAEYGEGAAAIGGLDAGEVSITLATVDLESACENTLVGVWTAPISEVFAILSAPYGGAPPACEGPFLVTFTPEHTWQTAFDAVCTVGDVSAGGSASLSGTYTNTAETFTVADITGSGQMTIFGQTQPLPIIDGYRSAMGSEVPYTVADDRLTYSFTAPDGNHFTLTLSRAR